MNSLIHYFPKELGLPYRVKAINKQEFFRIINENNGIKTIYYSLYDYPYEQCKIDKIHFDLDKDDALEAVKQLHDYCKFENLKHLMIFSGRRYQFYIFTQNYENIINKKCCLKNTQHYIAKACSLAIGEPNQADIDFHLIGDIARLVRVPNTIHLTTKLYAIPLAEGDIIKGEDFIKTKAKKQVFNFVYYGKALLDIKHFDNENKQEDFKIELGKEIIEKIGQDKVLNKFKCKAISNMLLADYVSWRNCFHIVCYLRDNSFSLVFTKQLLKKYLSNKKTTDGQDIYYKRIYKEGMVNRIYNSSNYFFSCKKMQEEGNCIKDCKERMYL